MDLYDVEIIAPIKKVIFSNDSEKVYLPSDSIYKIRLINHSVVDVNAVVEIDHHTVWDNVLRSGEDITLKTDFQLDNDDTFLRTQFNSIVPLEATKPREMPVMMLSMMSGKSRPALSPAKKSLPHDAVFISDVHLLPY